MKKVLLLLLGLIILVLLIYFGSKSLYKQTSSSSTMNPTPATEIQPNIVVISNFSFQPNTLTIKTGTEVTFKNEDSVVHTVTSNSFDSGNINLGNSYKRVFTDKGTFDYHCSLHPTMTGQIIVTQ